MSSTDTRLTHRKARVIAEALDQFWKLGHDRLWCGSLRRGTATVGDLDLVAALPAGDRDVLFESIDSTMEKQGGLFSAARPLGVPLKGHKPHFKAAYYTLKTQQNESVGLNIWRYQPGNKGWTLIRCTGPEQFGIMFLSRWKERFGITKDQQASIDGHLVDRYGVAIPTESEEDAFRLAGWSFIPPQDRERVAAHWAGSTGRKEFPQ